MNRKHLAKFASVTLLVGAFSLPVSTAQAAPSADVQALGTVKVVPTPKKLDVKPIKVTPSPGGGGIRPLSNGPYP